MEAIANQPEPQDIASKRSAFKIADPQYIISSDPAATVEEMTDALWQSIGGHEILSVVRRDLVDGKNSDYGLISGLNKLFAEYNPKTIISIENVSNLYFNGFGIKFEKYVPSEESLSTIQDGLLVPILVDDDHNISIYVSNIQPSYEVEIQSITSDELFRDTIYLGAS